MREGEREETEGDRQKRSSETEILQGSVLCLFTDKSMDLRIALCRSMDIKVATN